MLGGPVGKESGHTGRYGARKHSDEGDRDWIAHAVYVPVPPRPVWPGPSLGTVARPFSFVAYPRTQSSACGSRESSATHSKSRSVSVMFQNSFPPFTGPVTTYLIRVSSAPAHGPAWHPATSTRAPTGSSPSATTPPQP